MPVTASTSLGAKLLALFSSSESMLGVIGCAMACASGGFALYMNTHPAALSDEPGSHYFTVFAQIKSNTRTPRLARVEPAAIPVVVGDEIDPVVTGSIRDRSPTDPITVNRTARLDTTTRLETKTDRPILSDFVLRQIEGNNALVEVGDRLIVYKIGDTIPGAGRLVAMTRQGGRPALETTSGLIMEAN